MPIMLLCIVMDTDVKQRLAQACGGSGRALVPLLKAEAAKATGKDRTLVASKLSSFVNKGHIGELTLQSFNDHYKEYNRLV